MYILICPDLINIFTDSDADVPALCRSDEFRFDRQPRKDQSKREAGFYLQDFSVTFDTKDRAA